MDFTSKIQPKNFVAEYKEEKKKLGFTMGKLTRPKEFHFRSVSKIFLEDEPNETSSTIKPLFPDAHKPPPAGKVKKLKRVNTARLNMLAQETRRHKLTKDQENMVDRVKSSFLNKVPLDWTQVQANLYKTMGRVSISKEDAALKCRRDILCMSKPAKPDL